MLDLYIKDREIANVEGSRLVALTVKPDAVLDTVLVPSETT